MDDDVKIELGRMKQAAIDNNAENKEKFSDRKSDKTLKITSAIIKALHNPAITLSAALVVGGLTAMANPFNKKWFEAKKRARITRTLASNFSVAGLTLYVLSVAGGQFFELFQVYRHAVGIELNKRGKDVTPIDLMRRTKNTVVRDTMKQFWHRVPLRIGALLTPLIPSFIFDKPSPSPVMSGAMSVEDKIEDDFFPTVWDGISKLTPVMRDSADKITANEINDILVRHRQSVHGKKYSPPAPCTEDEKNDVILTNYVARLLNENRAAYEIYEKGGPKISSGYFKTDGFIYLMGNEAKGTGESFLDQKFPTNLCYIELARRDDDKLSKVKEVASAIANKENPYSVFFRYGIDVDKLAKDAENACPSEETESIVNNIQQQEHDKLTPATPSSLTKVGYAQKERIRAESSIFCPICRN